MFVLSLLKRDYPDLYNRSHVHISDASITQMSEVEDLGLFHDFEGHYSIESLPIDHVSFAHPPVF